MPEITEIRFDGGSNQHISARVLPEGKILREVVNMRLTHDCELSQRPGYQALATSTYSANALVAYDLATFGDRLVAIGDQTGRGYPTDVFEYVNSAAAWRGTMGADITDMRIPPATDLRDISRLPDPNVSVTAVRVAVSGNIVAVAYVAGSASFAQILRADTEQVLLTSKQTVVDLHVVVVGAVLVFVGKDASSNVVAWTFDPASSETLTSLGTIIAAGAAISQMHVAAVTGASQFIIAIARNSTPATLIQRFSTAGVSQGSFAGPAATCNALSVEASSAANRINLVRTDTATDTIILNTFNLTTGAGVAGPTTLFAAGTTAVQKAASCSVVRHSGVHISVTANQDGTDTVDLRTQDFANEDNHGASTFLTTLFDACLTAQVIVTSIGLVAAHMSQKFGAEPGTACLTLLSELMPLAQKDQDLAVLANDGVPALLHGLAVSGSKLYWGQTILSNVFRSGKASLVAGIASEVTLGSTARRQTAMLGNYLNIAGAIPLMYDGVSVYEIGFAERPNIYSVTGSDFLGTNLTLLGAYDAQVDMQYSDVRGNVHRSAPSRVRSYTLVGTEDGLVVSATRGHSLRARPALIDASGATVRLGYHHTTAGGENLHLDEVRKVFSTDGFGQAFANGTLATPDATLRGFPTIYTQSQTPVAHVAPQPFRYVFAGRERLIAGGLPLEELWQQSKLLFPAEAVAFAPIGRLGFSGRVESAIRGVAAFEETAIIFTRHGLWEIPGDGPEVSGLGEFQRAREIPSPTGLEDWRSIAMCQLGCFFKGDTNKLLLLTRNREVIWRGYGELVRDTLAQFPVVAATTPIRRQHAVAFACQNVAGDAGGILIYDLRRGVWFFDDVGAVAALAEYDGRLAYLQGGVVFLQDVDPGTGAMPTQRIDTFSFNFGTVLDWGEVLRVGVAGEYLGDASLELFFTQDEFATAPQSLGVWSFTAAGGYSLGKPIQALKAPPVQRVGRFALRAVVTGGSGSAGLKLNALAIETSKAPGMVRAPVRDTK